MIFDSLIEIKKKRTKLVAVLFLLIGFGYQKRAFKKNPDELYCIISEKLQARLVHFIHYLLFLLLL